MDKTRTVGQKWLAQELDLQFLMIRECTKFQSSRLILSKVIEYTDRHHPKNHFFSLWGLKTWRFDEKKAWGGGQILHKSNTFSDENVKIKT